MDYILKLKNIKKTFYTEYNETEVIKDLSLEIKQEQIISLIGPSGCGKSTILNIISGLEEQSSGEIYNNTKIGYMFQKDYLLPWLNVEKNVLFGLDINKIKTPESKEYANELLKKYGLWDFKDYFPDELSGGMKQRVSLIRTLVLMPELLLLDEPFSALDSQTRLIVQEDVFNILKNEKKSALMVTHDISEAISLSDRVIVLSKRPLTIKKEYYLNFDKSLKPTMRRKHENFQNYFNEIYANLCAED